MERLRTVPGILLIIILGVPLILLAGVKPALSQEVACVPANICAAEGRSLGPCELSPGKQGVQCDFGSPAQTQTPAPTPTQEPPPSTQPSGDDGGIFGEIGDFFVKVLNVIGAFFKTLIHAIAYVFLLAANALISAALTFNEQIGKDLIAKKGYDIVLGVANMGFIVALVVIAFATMFRQEAFSYKKALPRLIIAALLINFGFFIITNWFIDPVNQVTIAIHNASGFNPAGSFLSDFSNEWSPSKVCSGDDCKSFGVAAAGVFAGVLFTLFLDFLAIIALFSFAIMLWIRYIALVILIILLPLAWVAWIFPNLKIPGGGNPWSEWWETFLRWLLFAPFAMFFFWLALSFTSHSPSPLGDVTSQINAGDIGVEQSVLGNIAGMFVIIGILLGGLIVSNKMGINGASYALAIAKKGGGWARTKAGSYGRRIGYAALKRTRAEEGLRKMSTVGGGLNKWYQKPLRGALAPVRAAGRGASMQTSKLDQAREAEVKKKLENLPPYRIAQMYSGLGEAERAAALKLMIEKGYDWELVPGAREDLMNWADKGYFDRDVYSLKKAELDLIDMGIVPEAMAVQRKTRRDLEEARKGGAGADELAKIQHQGERGFRDTMFKALNVIPANKMGQLQRRVFSDYRDAKDEAPYQMFSGDKEGFEQYQKALLSYVTEERPYAITSVRGATRGDGAARIQAGTAAELTKMEKEVIMPTIQAMQASGITATKTPEDFAKLKRPDQAKYIRDYWGEVQLTRQGQINADVGRLTFLSPKERSDLIREEVGKMHRLRSEEALARYQRLQTAAQGWAFTAFAA